MGLMIHVTTPVCAVGGKQLHAVKATSKPRKSKRKTYDAACGKRAVLLGFPVQGRSGDYMTVAWPPYVVDAQEWGYERCKDCMTASPGKPQRPPFVNDEVA